MSGDSHGPSDRDTKSRASTKSREGRTVAGPAPDDRPGPASGLQRALHRSEDAVTVAALTLMVVLPLAEMASRGVLARGIPGSGPFVQVLTLWVGFLGAVLAAREGRLLQLATGNFIPAGAWRAVAGIFSGFVGAAVCVVLAAGSWQLVQIEREGGAQIALGVTVWMAQLVLPAAFTLLALRLIWHAAQEWWGRALAGAGAVVGLIITSSPELFEGLPVWPGLLLIVAATILGGPIFVALGGAAVLLFLADGVPVAAIPAETYRLSVWPTLAAIPLFTLTGFLLAEGKASERLLEVFRALFGWIPGGTAVVCALICAFFTVFTGGSGVTILALGALLLKALLADRYREQFSIGLLTAVRDFIRPPVAPLVGSVAGRISADETQEQRRAA